MKISFIFSDILGLILFLPFLTVTSTDFPKASENFAKEYYRVISKTDENVICSPLSIEIGLAMISVGAGGPTKWALLNLFGTKVYPEEASYHQSFLSDLNSCDSRTRLDLANKIFVSDRYQLKPEFINIMKYGYRSEPQEMNFANAEETANLINQWVEDKTNKKIADLVQPNSINSDTGMILVNAAYFLGTWEKPFREDLTRKEEFYLLNGDEITCDMMHKKARYGSLYDRKLKAVVLEMKYADKDTRMLFFLPDEDSSLEYLKENINQFDFQNYSMTFMETDVVIPKFKISSMFDLKDKLSEVRLLIFTINLPS